MTVNGGLILYTRPGCHLCDRAAELLDELGCDWRPVDIEGHPELEDRYGLVIPVVYSERTKKELPFPFGIEQLSRYLEEL